MQEQSKALNRGRGKADLQALVWTGTQQQQRAAIFWEQQLQDSRGCSADKNRSAIFSLCITIKKTYIKCFCAGGLAYITVFHSFLFNKINNLELTTSGVFLNAESHRCFSDLNLIQRCIFICHSTSL